MTINDAAAAPEPRIVIGERSLLRAVAVPTEHGGWSLTVEPVLLGLLVAFSWPGVALGAAAIVAFVARTPLKLVLVDRWRGRRLDRTIVARRVVVVELIVLVALVAVGALGANGRIWLPLIAAAPLVAMELWFDMRSRGRRLVPELAGTIGIGSVAAAIALADGATTDMALGLWVVVAARAAAAIPYRANAGVPHPRSTAPPLAQRRRTSPRRGCARHCLVRPRRPPRVGAGDRRSGSVQRRGHSC